MTSSALMYSCSRLWDSCSKKGPKTSLLYYSQFCPGTDEHEHFPFSAFLDQQMSFLVLPQPSFLLLQLSNSSLYSWSHLSWSLTFSFSRFSFSVFNWSNLFLTSLMSIVHFSEIPCDEPCWQCFGECPHSFPLIGIDSPNKVISVDLQSRALIDTSILCWRDNPG